MSTTSTRTGGRRLAATVALVAGLALVLAGCGENLGTAQPVGPGAPAPSGSPTTSAPAEPQPKITESMLLTDDNLNQIGQGWQTVSTGKVDDGEFMRCQQQALEAIGATEVLVRTFERPAAEIGPATQAGHLIAYFRSEDAMPDVNKALNTWLRTCADHATGGDSGLHWVAGALAVDTVHRRGPEGPGSGEVWGLTFDDENTDDEYGWFESVGYGIVAEPYLTIVNYTDWGQDANYELEQLPGVVLLQDAFEKLPA